MAGGASVVLTVAAVSAVALAAAVSGTRATIRRGFIRGSSPGRFIRAQGRGRVLLDLLDLRDLRDRILDLTGLIIPITPTSTSTM
jgi:hypothetical protein